MSLIWTQILQSQHYHHSSLLCKALQNTVKFLAASLASIQGIYTGQEHIFPTFASCDSQKCPLRAKLPLVGNHPDLDIYYTFLPVFLMPCSYSPNLGYFWIIWIISSLLLFFVFIFLFIFLYFPYLCLYSNGSFISINIIIFSLSPVISVSEVIVTDFWFLPVLTYGPSFPCVLSKRVAHFL